MNRKSVFIVPKLLAGIAAVLALSLSLGGWFIYRNEAGQLRAERYSDLKSISELKAAGLSAWARERTNNATAFSLNPINETLIRPFLSNTGPAQAAGDIRAWLESLLKSYGYEDVVLMDHGGQIRLSAGVSKPKLGPFALANIKNVQRSLRPLLSDIHLANNVSFVHLDLYVPLFGRSAPGVARTCIGVLMFRIDPARFLYSYMQSWPTSSRTAETLLVSRDGDNVVFLNKLRYSSSPPLSLRFPLTNTHIPAVQAVLGTEGLFEGRDYRGAQVLADLRPVPGTPWFIVSKMDSDEIYSELHFKGWVILAFVVLGVLLTGGVIVLAYNIRQRKLYQVLAVANKARLESEDKYRTLVQGINDIVYSVSIDGVLTYISPQISRYGWTPGELIGRSFMQLISEEDRANVAADFAETIGSGREMLTEFRGLSKSGEAIWFNDNGKVQRDGLGNITGATGVLVNITERKRAEEALRKREEIESAINERLAGLLVSPGLKDGDLPKLKIQLTEAAAGIAGVARASIWLYSDGGRELRCIDLYEPGIKKHSEGVLLKCADYPRYFKAINSQSCIAANDARLDPDTSEFNDGYLTPLGITSMLDSMIPGGTGACGVFCLEHVGEPRVWSAQEVSFLGTLSTLTGLVVDASRQKEAAAALGESEGKYRTLFEDSQDALMTLFPPDWMFSSCNRATVALFAAKNAEEFTTAGPWLVSPEHQPDGELSSVKSKRMIEAAMEKGTHFFEWTHKKIGGADFQATVLLTRVELNGKKGLQATVRDITERKQAEKAALKEQAMTNAAIDSIPGAFYMLDAGGHYVRWNAYQRDEIVGKPDDQVAGMAAIDTIHPDDRTIIQSKIESVLRNGTDEAVEGRVLLRGGPAFRWLLMTGRRMVVDGRAFLIGIGMDITERKRNDRELIESKAFIDSVVENVPLMIFLKDAKDLRFSLLNRAGEELLGHDRKALLGKNDLDFFPPEQADFFISKDREILNGTPGFMDIPEEPVSTAKKGQRWLHTRKVCIRGSEGEPKYLLGISEDITERKLAENVKRNMQLQLDQSQKMESVGRLAGGVAHDFNNLLTAISGYAGFLMRALPDEDPKRNDVREILNATERAAGLTRQLLAFSRKQVLNPAIIDLNSSVRGMVEMLGRLIGETVKIEVKLSAQPCHVKVDAGQLDQVIVNLAVNARDAMSKGGKLTLQTELVVPDDIFLEFRPDLPRGPLVCLSVSDTGSGITAEIKKHLFEPFFTSKEKGKGTGLGLSTVFGIIKQSGGEIEVDSQPNIGTMFRIYFPHIEVPVQHKDRDKDKDKDKDTLLCGSETVLLVEDEESLRRMGERMLTACGYAVITAADGKAALEAAARHGKPVDLLLTDVIMPGMSGRELAAELSRRKQAHRTLFMSGYTDDALVEHGVLEPGIAFISKPFTLEALSIKLREVFEGPADKARA